MFFLINSRFRILLQLMIGRFLTGIAAGCYSYILPIYVGEISSTEIRGSLLGMFQVALNSGVLFVFTLGHFGSLQVLNIVCGSLTLVYSLAFLALPESPVLLIRHNRESDARASIKILRCNKHHCHAEIEDIKRQHQEALSQRKTFSEVFKTKSTKKAFWIMMLQFTFFQLCGINVVLFYSTTIFIAAGINIEAGIASIIVAAVQLPSVILSVALVDRFGRKFLLILSNTLMCLGLIGIGSYFSFIETTEDSRNSFGWLPVMSLCVLVFGFGIGMGPVSYVLLGELFLQEAKAFVAPIGQTLNFALTFVISLTFLMLTASLGIGPTFFMFAGFCALAVVFTVAFIPETKGKTIEEIQKLLSWILLLNGMIFYSAVPLWRWNPKHWLIKRFYQER